MCISLPPHGHHPRRVCELGFNFLFPSLFPFLSLTVLPLIPPFQRPTFPQCCSTWWLCVAAFVCVIRLSELFSPSLSPPSFSTHWHVSLVERVKECNPYWNGLWWRQSCQEASLPCCFRSGFLSFVLPVEMW